MTTYVPRADSPFYMTAEQVAAWFLDIHHEWFDDPYAGLPDRQFNFLFNREDACHDALVAYIKEGAVPRQVSEEYLRYVIGQFSKVQHWFIRRVQ